ncbi:DUF4280 domain-containing protein [Cellulomonas composti]|uniref:DUF4280 domain-containing protein n=1 Tax=Cellulomonas composti TaxID=266130 RepID=A0A511JAS2_9CELL|nr:DUF4280 domain-containing protein [Cellulomonas composti]GEL95064.1 hypothetical protein CCO02nite_17220 [Cellulomonas composti]
MGKPAAVATATLTCTFGLAPSTLNVLPVSGVLVEGKPAATIMDQVPVLNIPPFGMCQSLANPTVAAATAAALGVLTPMPCIPVTTAPWVPGSPQTLIGGKPALTAGSQCMCAWGGVVQIVNPGSVRTLEG